MGRQETAYALLANMLTVLLRRLRHDLLREGDTKRKIKITYSIFDCASLVDKLREVSERVRDPGLLLLPLSEATRIASAGGEQDLRLLLSRIDGTSTDIRRHDFPLCSAVRRSMVHVADLYHVGDVVPAHDDVASTLEEMTRVEGLPWPSVPSRPKRESGQGGGVEISRGDSLDLVERLHWQLFGIEVNAAEICAAIPLRFPALPWRLDYILANQTHDEGRHAALILHQLVKRGGEVGSFAPPFETWDKALRGRTLEEAICIEQVLGEGYALGYDLMAVDEYEQAGESALAEIHRSLHVDEMMHAADGIRFLRSSAAEDLGAMTARLQAKLAVVPPPEPWFRPDLREAVGFSMSEIEGQREFRGG